MGTELASTLPLSGDRWEVDPEASFVRFKVRHFQFAWLEGRFSGFSGRIDDGDIGGSVDVASIDTGNAIRDGRLLSPEFFDADRFPCITFSSCGPLATTLAGRLTIRDRTEPITLAVTPAEAGDGALGLHCAGVISRARFGLDWPGLVEAGRLVVSDRVHLALDLVVRRPDG